ncbi:MAG: 3-hydroxyacyl-CoA dehydrogenase NAD-binding domain-containing protein [Vicinamibacterales bacterium]
MTESTALAHLAAAEQAAQAMDAADTSDAAPPIRRAAIVGAGTMGRGIAMCFAAAAIPVRLLDSDSAAVSRGLASIASSYAAAEAKGRQTREETERRLGAITAAGDYADLADADLVVEAAFEEMDVKRDVFARLDAVCRPDAILATNTSSLDVAALARGTAHPGRVIGMHFFSPAHVMRLVEIVRPDTVDRPVLVATRCLARTLGKIGVVVGVCDGFVGNRMLFAYRQQANFLLEEGAAPEQIDRALTAFGLPMGPYQMGDLAGLDISWRIRKRQAATRPPHLRYSRIADVLCERGRFGQKTGAGWYRYEPGRREPIPDPEVLALIESISAEMGIRRRAIADDEIVERCLFPLVNEGARILDEGIAERAGDIDVIWVHGYGFPKGRGGPMFWAADVGFDRVARTIERLHADQGELVPPARLLETLARSGARAWPR